VPQIRGQVNISQQQRIAAALQHQLSQGGARMSPQQQQMMQAQVRVLEQQAQAQGQGQPGQTPAPQQPTIQVQTQNLPQPVQFANGTSTSPPPLQAVSSTSGTPVSASGSVNGNGGPAVQRSTPVQSQDATTTTPPLDADTAAVITSIGARPVASYYNAMQTLQSMFEINDGVTVNANGSTQTRFQATPQV
jgi:hypothetical protein